MKHNTDIIENCRQHGSKNFTQPPLDSITKLRVGTPVSLQTPVNAGSLVLSHLLYEKSLLVTESNLSLDEPGLTNLPCHHHGHAFEVFIPHNALLKCQIPKYPKLNWCIEVTSADVGEPPDILAVRVEDSSTINIRRPLLHLAERKNHIEYLMQDKGIEAWLKTNKESYWWLRLSYSPYSISRVESQVRTVNIKFPPSHSSCAIYTHPILHAFHFARRHSAIPIHRNMCMIERVYLGYQHGRLLPDKAMKGINFFPPMSLLAEQAKVFNHVLSHDFTVVDGAPATGKSRVTADIILAFLLAGKRVLVMTTNDVTLDFLATSVLSALPQGDVRVSGVVARLRPPTRYGLKPPNDHKETILESVSVVVSFRRPAAYGGKPPYAPSPSIAVRDRLEKTPVIFMTTQMAERLDPFFGVTARRYDLIVLDDANTCSESLGLQLSQQAFASSTRWLVIGCSKGISPRVNIDEFKKMEICGSWHTRLLRHPEFRLNPLRLTKQSRLRKALYEPINNMCFNNTITCTTDCPQEEGDHELCMGFVNTARMCKRKRKPDIHDEEIMETVNYRKEITYVFTVAIKIHHLTPHASIVVMCHNEAQKLLLYSELERVRELATATIVIQTIDEFVNKEAVYAIIHLPLWKGSYSYTDDAGRFVTAMTRVRKGVFVVGNLRDFAEHENRRGTWATNPWKVWMMQMNKSAHGAVFEEVAEVNLEIGAKELATFKKARAEMGRWLGERYTKEELAKLRSYW